MPMTRPNWWDPYAPDPLDELFGIPANPRRSANRFGIGQAGLALLASAGSPNYAQSIARAMSAYGQGRSSELDRYQDLARQRQTMELARERQALADEREGRLVEAETERQRRQAEADRMSTEDRSRRLGAEKGERDSLWAQIPESTRPRYSRDFTDIEILRKAAYPPDAKPRDVAWVDFGGYKELQYGDTGEPVLRAGQPVRRQETPGPRQPGSGEDIELRADLGSEILIRYAHGSEERIPKTPGRTGGSTLTAAGWLDSLKEIYPDAQLEALAVEAERRAAGEPHLNPATGKPVAGSGATGGPGAADAAAAVSSQAPGNLAQAKALVSGLPESVRSTPGLERRIAEDLAAGKSITEITREILATARRVGIL